MGLAPVPAGVAMPPISGPKAHAIISALPKLLFMRSSPASSSKLTPRGKRIAATAMSVIHIESEAPATRNPRSTRSVRVPTLCRIRSAMRVPSPERVNAAERIRTPIKKVTMGCPKPRWTASA